MQSTLPPNLENLEKTIRIQFKNIELAKLAFIHTSYLNEHKEEVSDDNERLEFLGDAVLELVATEYLYEKFPTKGEGELTNFRSALVKGNHLAEVARELDLGAFLMLSRGEEKSKGREKDYILANVLEALIGAIYLDRGFAAAHTFISRFILERLSDIVKKGLHVDSKSKLQEISQEKFGITPGYQVLSETGPDHFKTFEVGVFVGKAQIGVGTGSSKQKGEQAAATNALKLEKKWKIKPEGKN